MATVCSSVFPSLVLPEHDLSMSRYDTGAHILQTHKFEEELGGAGQWGSSKRSVELAKLGLEDCRSGQARATSACEGGLEGNDVNYCRVLRFHKAITAQRSLAMSRGGAR